MGTGVVGVSQLEVKFGFLFGKQRHGFYITVKVI
jgi:hypothetical protein